ncbi:MAG: hypothetical protein ACRES2_01195 [Steroidobacteraceae bacterium]
MNAGLKILGVLTLVCAGPAADCAAAQGPPVNFAIAKGDGTIFYPTRALRYGDMFAVTAHHLNEYNRLMVVPCRPSCEKPNYVLTYTLRFGLQHLRIPISGHYYFWLERDQIGGPGVPYRNGWTRLPLPVLDSQTSADHFLAAFDKGTTLSIRTIDAHPVEEVAYLMH